jgi:hypothetical protein
LAAIKAKLDSLKNQHASYARAAKAIDKTIRETEQIDAVGAIKYALKAMDKLDKIDSDDARSVQMDIAHAIRSLAMQWAPDTDAETDTREWSWP